MNLHILLPVLTVLLLTACTQTIAVLTPVPQAATPDAPVIQTTPAAAVLENSTPDAVPPASPPEPSRTPKATSTIVPYPILRNTPTPMPSPTAIAIPTPTAVPTRVPTPDATEVFTTPAPTPPPEHQAPARNEYPFQGGSQQQHAFGAWLPPVDCSGEDAKFSASPVDVEDLWYITPQGKLHGGHVTPTDHTYFVHNKLRDYEMQANAVRSGGSSNPWIPPFSVKSPADGLIVRIGTFPFGPAPEGYTGTLEDYRVIIWHSCKLSTIFIHLVGLDSEILKLTGKLEGGSQGWSIPIRGDGRPGQGRPGDREGGSPGH